jgi:import inner membrane translocase subunit TIM22
MQMSAAMESCPSKMAISGVMGFGLGGLFGLFMASMRYDTPMGAIGGGLGADGKPLPAIPMREQIKSGFKDMGRSAWSSAKNFGYIGGIYAGSECAIEGFRAKSDLVNGVAAGCFTGGFLARSAGPQAAAVGCAGFAAFSAAIDAYMRMESDDKAQDPII